MMVTMTIRIPKKAEDKLSAIVKEMGGEVISVVSDKESLKKQKLLNEIRQGLIEAKRIQEGKAKGYSISDIFDGK
jgi:hypothetical protein